MFTATRKFTFDAAHRLLGHKGRCRHLHGHTYTAEVVLMTEKVDDLGMVLDFGDLKQSVGKWIDDNWDHNFICHEDDPLLPALISLPEQDRVPFVMPRKMNPTAENLAVVLFWQAAKSVPENVRVYLARVYETPNCSALFATNYDKLEWKVDNVTVTHNDWKLDETTINVTRIEPQDGISCEKEDLK